jgi:hypothetical protein
MSSNALFCVMCCLFGSDEDGVADGGCFLDPSEVVEEVLMSLGLLQKPARPMDALKRGKPWQKTWGKGIPQLQFCSRDFEALRSRDMLQARTDRKDSAEKQMLDLQRERMASIGQLAMC